MPTNPTSTHSKPELWILVTGLAIFLTYLPDGLIHLKLGPAAYGRDILMGLHLGVAAYFLERQRLLLPFLKLAWPILVGALCFLPLFLAKTQFRDFVVHVKWILLWTDWMILGYLLFRVRTLRKSLLALAITGCLFILIDSGAGYYEVTSGQFLLPIESSEETASGEQLGRSQTLGFNIRAQGFQRSVFAFSNMMGLGLLLSLAYAVYIGRSKWMIFPACIAGWFFYVAFVSGGRSSLLGMLPVISCFFWCWRSPKHFIQHFPKAALVMVISGMAMCIIGLGNSISTVIAPFAHQSRTFSMASVYERDEIWAERLQTLMDHPVALITGMPSIAIFHRNVNAIDFADNTLLYLLYHFGLPITLLILSVIYRTTVDHFRMHHAKAYILFAFSLAFIWGEGIARDTLWYFGCMPLFFSLGYLIAARAAHPAKARDPSRLGSAERAGLAATAAMILLLVPAPAYAAPADVGVSLSAPGNVFIEGESVELPAAALGNWTLRDAEGETLSEGSQTSGTLTLDDLKPGFYRFSAEDFNTAITIVAKPPERLQTRFCLDVAGSELVPQMAGVNPFQPDNGTETLAELTRRAGVGMVRDRMYWPIVNPARSEFNWHGYPRSVGDFSSREIQVMMVFQAAPKWALMGRTTQPGDLLATYHFAKNAAAEFSGKVTAWEFWNEPDEHFCFDPAWDYAAGMKAAGAGFRAGDPEATVLIGSNAQHPIPRFIQLSVANGSAPYFDVFNFHTYSPAGALIQMSSQKHAFLATQHVPDMPLWLTEIGWRGQENGRVHNFLTEPRRDEHDEEQELQQAAFLVQSMVTAASRDIERTFYFILTPFNEDQGRRPWGLLRWDWTAKPAYAALATLNAMTHDKEYKGFVTYSTGVAAHVFEAADGQQSMVAWAESPTNIPVDGLTPATRIHTAFGNARDPVEKTESYVTVALDRLPVWISGLSNVMISPRPPGAADAPGPAKTSEASMDVVFSILIQKPFEVRNRVAASLDAPGTGSASLAIWNLSDTQQTVHLQDLSSGIELSDMPPSVDVPPASSVDVPIRVTLPSSPATLRELKIAGFSAGKFVTPIVVPMRLPEDGLGTGTGFAIPVENPLRWRESASVFMKVNQPDPGEGVEFVAWFDEGKEKWIYPVFGLLGEDESFEGSSAIQFEIKVVEGEAHKAFFMAGRRNGPEHQFEYRPRSEWTKVTFIWAQDAPEGFNPASCENFKIGMNPITPSIRYRVRNMQLFYANQ